MQPPRTESLSLYARARGETWTCLATLASTHRREPSRPQRPHFCQFTRESMQFCGRRLPLWRPQAEVVWASGRRPAGPGWISPCKVASILNHHHMYRCIDVSYIIYIGRGSGDALAMATIRCLFKGCNETHEIFVAKNGRPYINCSGLANKFYGNNDRSKSMLTGSVRSNPNAAEERFV